MKGFKAFNEDWTCLYKQYSCPGEFEEEGLPAICNHGMHFCKRLRDVFCYYPLCKETKVAEVEAYGDVVTDEEKSCTNKLRIIREIPWEEILAEMNFGINNKGRENIGHNNNGDYNTGNGNNGCNNSGSWNEGSYNIGSHNNGSFNSGSFNNGRFNAGTRNTGSGNVGSYNTGDYNTGVYNHGSYNTGDFNCCDHSAGCFNTHEPKIYMFNKPSNWTFEEWRDSIAYGILECMPSGRDAKARQDWWNSISNYRQSFILGLPNFDKEIFKKITLIDIDQK